MIQQFRQILIQRDLHYLSGLPGPIRHSVKYEESILVLDVSAADLRFDSEWYGQWHRPITECMPPPPLDLLRLMHRTRKQNFHPLRNRFEMMILERRQMRGTEVYPHRLLRESKVIQGNQAAVVLL